MYVSCRVHKYGYKANVIPIPSLHTDVDGIDGAYNNVACMYG